jgi:hypothetical protein
MLIENPAIKVLAKYLGFLLLISCRPVQLVSFLNFFLVMNQTGSGKTSFSKGLSRHTGSS